MEPSHGSILWDEPALPSWTAPGGKEKFLAPNTALSELPAV